MPTILGTATMAAITALIGVIGTTGDITGAATIMDPVIADIGITD